MKAITAEDRERLGDARVIVGMSGGKDSTALAIHLRENGIDFEAVFMDTGWEHEATYSYLSDVLEPLFGPIRVLRSSKWPGGFPEAVRDKGMFPSRMLRWCTQQLKVFPLRDYITGPDFDRFEVVSAVGIRKEESRARSRMTRWEYNKTYDCDVWRPLIDWTEADVIEAHHRAGIAPNPLYLKGFSRVGCFPCIMARKREIRMIADSHPERIDVIRQLETDAHKKAVSRKAAKGEAPPERPPTMFQAKTGGTGHCWPIDRVVDWSRTPRGGAPQIEMFAPSEIEEQGCVRWGLCESMQADPS